MIKPTKIYKNKKGIAGPLVDFYAYLAFALVILAFFLLFNLGAGQIQQQIKSEYIELGNEQIMFNYLKNPIKISGEDSTISKLIIISTTNNDHVELKRLTKLHLDPIYFINDINSWRTWIIRINTMPQNKEFFIKGQLGTNKGRLKTLFVSNNTLPLPLPNTYLDLELFKHGRGTAMD
jgi:hypothetical protein